MAEKKTKGIRLTRNLLIAALAYECPFRVGGDVLYHCDTGDGHPTNCTPHLCTHCTDIFRTMTKISTGEIDFDANLKVR